jgi:outer membrane protein assembly factor BamC
METNWSENRAKLPTDVVRNLIGRLVGNLFDTGERDLFRTRLERIDKGTEIYVSHRGVEEAFVGTAFNQSTQWRARPNDPDLEAEMIARLMLALGAGNEAARAAAAAGAAPATGGAAAPAGTPARARITATAPQAALEVDDPFDRAWRRVGLTLDRGGFTVEDRDRSAGTYFVRYVDPKAAGQEEPNFFARLFGAAGPSSAPVRYRIVLRGALDKTSVQVLTSDGKPEVGEHGRQIVDRLVSDLR